MMRYLNEEENIYEMKNIEKALKIEEKEGKTDKGSIN